MQWVPTNDIKEAVIHTVVTEEILLLYMNLGSCRTNKKSSVHVNTQIAKAYFKRVFGLNLEVYPYKGM